MVVSICLSLFILGCNHSTNDHPTALTESSAPDVEKNIDIPDCPSIINGVKGCWSTSDCGQRPPIIEGEVINDWSNTLVLFNDLNRIEMFSRAYNNPDCLGEPKLVGKYMDMEIEYGETEKLVDPAGVTVNGVRVTMILGENAYEYDSAYHISNQSRLCLSQNFSILPTKLSFHPAGPVDIDFVNCLIRE